MRSFTPPPPDNGVIRWQAQEDVDAAIRQTFLDALFQAGVQFIRPLEGEGRAVEQVLLGDKALPVLKGGAHAGISCNEATGTDTTRIIIPSG